MKKNICLVVQDYYPADIRVRKYALLLRSKGFGVYVVALRDMFERHHEFVEGISVYRAPLRKKRGGFLRYIFEYGLFFLYAFFKLNILDARHTLHAVHINTLPDFLVFSAILQKLKRRRIILDMHEIMPEFFMSKYGSSAGSLMIRLLLLQEKLALSFADRILTVNDPIKERFKETAVPDRDITVIMNSVDESIAVSFSKRPHLHFNCVYHGTVSKIYRIDIALKGFAAAVNGHTDMRFHVIGDGPELPRLKRLASELGIDKFVKFYGKLPYDRVLNVLGEMDLGIISVPKDIFLDLSFSNKLAEYVYLKIPLIHSNIRTPMLYFPNGEILFFESGDIEDLKSKIASAYANRARLAKMADSARRRYRNYDWRTMQKRYLRAVAL